MIQVITNTSTGVEDHDGDAVTFTVDGGYLNIWDGSENRLAVYYPGSWHSARVINTEGG